MESLDPSIKKANLKLLVGLIVFALGLTALCIVWMHFHSERVYEEQMQGPSSFYRLPGARGVSHWESRVVGVSFSW